MQGQRGGSIPPPAPRSGGASSGGSEISAQLLDRVATLEDLVRRLRGQLDEQANANRRAQDDLNKQIADLTFRMQAAPGAPPAPGNASPPPGAPPPAAQNQPPARRPSELAMQEGNAALARRDYPMAEAAAREVLAGPRSPRQADAQFLLAQALTGKRDYQGAALAYDDVYTHAKTGPRAPDALLGVANALLALNDRAAACASLDKLRAEFPAMRPAVREGAFALRGRAGCR
jgi:TolA-binding protein